MCCCPLVMNTCIKILLMVIQTHKHSWQRNKSKYDPLLKQWKIIIFIYKPTSNTNSIPRYIIVVAFPAIPCTARKHMIFIPTCIECLGSSTQFSSLTLFDVVLSHALSHLEAFSNNAIILCRIERRIQDAQKTLINIVSCFLLLV